MKLKNTKIIQMPELFFNLKHNVIFFGLYLLQYGLMEMPIPFPESGDRGVAKTCQLFFCFPIKNVCALSVTQKYKGQTHMQNSTQKFSKLQMQTINICVNMQQNPIFSVLVVTKLLLKTFSVCRVT